MDFKKEFKNKLKEQTKGLDMQKSSPLSLFNQINEEYNSEIDRNPILKFKKTLSESKNEVTQNTSMSRLFDLLEQTKEEFQGLIEEESSEILVEEEILFEAEEPPTKDLISLAMDSISKEESFKFVPEHTNLFSQPNSKKPDPNIKALQSKLKMLEDWVVKISMAGPGGGSGSIIDIDTPITLTDKDYTMNRMDYCLLVNPSEKVYINLPPAHDQRKVIIKDISGHAQLTPIHINGTVEGDIDGAEIRVNYASLQLIYYGNSWWVI